MNFCFCFFLGKEKTIFPQKFETKKIKMIYFLQNLDGKGPLRLSEEEKKTLSQEGYSISTMLPLNQQEQKALKHCRRKILNKLSAHESRRKQREYIETLEQRYYFCFVFFFFCFFLLLRIRHVIPKGKGEERD